MGYIIQKFSFLIKIMIINKKIFFKKEKKTRCSQAFYWETRNGKVVFSAHLQLFSSPLFLLLLFNSQDLILGGSKVVSCNMELAQPRITALLRLCSKRSAAYLSCLLLEPGPHKKLLIEVHLNLLYAFTVEAICLYRQNFYCRMFVYFRLLKTKKSTSMPDTFNRMRNMYTLPVNVNKIWNTLM